MDSIPIEQAVIGSILTNPQCVSVIESLVTKQDFFDALHGEIFHIAVDALANRREVDAVLIAEELPRRGFEPSIGYLLELAQNTPSTHNAKHYASAVAKYATRRRVQQAALRISQMAEECEFDGLLDGVQAEIMAISNQARHSMTPLAEVLKTVVYDLDDRQQNPHKPRGLLTGFIDLDARIRGFRPGDLVIIAGRPSMGKTTLAMNIAERVARGAGSESPQAGRVVIFSHEMSKEQLVERMIASAGSVPFSRLREVSLRDDEWAKLATGVTTLKPARIAIDDSTMLRIAELRTRARAEHLREPLSLIVVDYLQLLRGEGHNREQEIASISRGLKALAKELGIPVLALSQLSRDLEKRPNKRPLMSDLRESGAIEQDADLIMFLYRDEVYNEDSPAKGVAEVITRKFRNGEVGTDYLAVQFNYCRFADLAGQRPSSHETAAGFDY